MKITKSNNPRDNVVLTKYDSKVATTFQIENDSLNKNEADSTNTKTTISTDSNNLNTKLETILDPEKLNIINAQNLLSAEDMKLQLQQQQGSLGYTNLSFDYSTSPPDLLDTSSSRILKNKFTEKKNDSYLERPGNIPAHVTLVWHSITITAQTKTISERLVSCLRCKKNSQHEETILKDVKGIVEPGEMLAMMGPSGSGKTTLLNALNFNIKGSLRVYGKILINGAEVDATRMAMVSGYIQQDDLFFGTLTVKEHLNFHAMLRMDKKLSYDVKLRRVNQVLKEFNLENRGNVTIGIPGKIKGISGGEKRRLSFASAILTDPAVLFCDEPTSGLDSFMAKSIIYFLQKMARMGKTIICTIHQPSSETFAIFDKICILSQTRVAYFGPRESALTFFTQNLRKECPPLTNPADFYMDTLGVDVADMENSRAKILNYCEIFLKSEYNQNVENRIADTKPQYFSVPSNYTPYKSTWTSQMIYLMQRAVFNYFRNYKVVITDFLMIFVTAILGGLIYWKSSEKDSNGNCSFDQRSAQNISFALFYTITVTFIVSMLAAVLAFPLEIPIYYREHSAAVYRSDAYYLSKLIIELPCYLILPAIHAIIIYFMVGFGCDGLNFAVFLLAEILVANGAYALGHILSIVSSDANMAISLTAPVIALQMLFSGFFLKKALNTPVVLTYLKFISIFNYAFDLMMMNQWENVKELKCEYDIALMCFPSGGAVLNDVRIRPKNKPVYIIMLFVLIITFRIIAFLILWIKGRRNPFRLTNICNKKTKKNNTIQI